MVDVMQNIEVVLFFILVLNTSLKSEDLKYKKHEYRNINSFSFKGQNLKIPDRVNINTDLFREFTARQNYQNFKTVSKLSKLKSNLKDGEVISFSPGQKSPPFSLWTLSGEVHFPSETFTNKSIFINVFNPNSGFLECLWTSDEALAPIVKETKENVSYIFIPKTAKINDTYGPVWMKNRLKAVVHKVFKNEADRKNILRKFYLSVHPLDKLGNWIPSLLNQWQCVDHNCGLDQVVLQSQNTLFPVVVKRHDARYDWLPNPSSTFGNKTLQLVLAGTGCLATSTVNGSVAMVSMDGCSYFQKISTMAKSGAVGVVIYINENQSLLDMNCNGSECATQISIPATMIHLSQTNINRMGGLSNITFQNTPSENFFMAIDNNGKLSEVGWFLFPSMKFLIWQSQWFDYRRELDEKLIETSKVVKIFENQKLQGANGVVINVSLPDLNELRMYTKMELDMSLSCPGDKDTTCPHWDHTINLYVCCDKKSPLCGMEFGRWISAFRRRIGRWLTDVTPLLPLLTNQECTFTMKTVAWAMPWIPSLSLRFSKPQKSGSLYPSEIVVLFEPGATFDKNYNSHFKPKTFAYPDDVKKVEVFAVITGHGSDENGCGEFCVTSHHFIVNKKEYNITFSDAGTPFGCADRVLTGVEPNEHGTWLYGRNGWCDGQNVFPWVFDITDQLSHSGDNTVKYFGYFNGTDPNPHQNPGLIYIYSYLVMYRAST